QKNASDSYFTQPRNVDIRDDPAHHHEHVVEPFLFEELHHTRADVHVGPGQNREPDRISVLLQRRRDNLLGRLTKAGVDDFPARVAQRACDHLGATVMAIESRLRDNDADLFHLPLSALLTARGAPPPRALTRRRASRDSLRRLARAAGASWKLAAE